MRLLTATTLAITLLAATPKAQPQSSGSTLQIYSRETVVDVTVTDSKGQPVHGLKQSDFTVKEDGKEQPIRSFQEFDQATLADVSASPKLPPNVYTNLEPPPASSAVSILLLDFVNTSPGGAPGATPMSLQEALEVQHLVKQEAMKYLHEMPPGTRVAVLAMTSPGSLRILQGVTSDPALLSAAVNTLDYVTQPVGGIPRVEMTLEIMPQIAAVASQIKGRKNLIWFTYGLAVMTDPAVIAEYCPHAVCPSDWPTRYLSAFSMLTEAQVTVYPIGARGVYMAGQPQTSLEVLALENMAEAGGGIAYHDSNDLARGVAQAIANGSDYYTLSYVPPGTQYDGRHHTIDVKVDQPNLHLTYRNYYYAEDPAKVLPPAQLSLNTTPSASAPGDMRAAMSRNLPTSTQLLFDVKVEPSAQPPKPTDPPVMGTLDPKLKKEALTRYGFLYLLPMSQIGFAQAADGTHKGSLEFDIAAYDTSGKMTTSLSQTMTLPLTQDEYQQFIQKPFQFFQQLDLPPGQAFLRIGVRDGSSNKVGTVEIPVTVGTHRPLAQVIPASNP